eukprot:8415194-Ditylum_brightwellii.AAC.1
MPHDQKGKKNTACLQWLRSPCFVKNAFVVGNSLGRILFASLVQKEEDLRAQNLSEYKSHYGKLF